MCGRRFDTHRRRRTTAFCRSTNTKCQSRLCGQSGSRRSAVTAFAGFVSNTEEYAKRLCHSHCRLSGIEVRRGSDCFVYWSDPQKGLTWGLNFVCADEANYFADLVVSMLINLRRSSSLAPRAVPTPTRTYCRPPTTIIPRPLAFYARFLATRRRWQPAISEPPRTYRRRRRRRCRYLGW